MQIIIVLIFFSSLSVNAEEDAIAKLEKIAADSLPSVASNETLKNIYNSSENNASSVISQPEQEDFNPNNIAAFDKVLSNLHPLTPRQILELRDRYEDTLRAASATAMTPPKPTITSQFVKLDTGSTPPIVRLAENFVSSLVFLDSTGSPWPIDSYNVGDPEAFSLQWNKVDNVIVIQAKTLFKYGNLVVRLQGLSTPVVITLIPGQHEVDYRRELRIQGLGPKASAVEYESMMVSESPKLLSVLDGISPLGSTAVQSSSPMVEAWRLGGKMFVRTSSKILSPAWVSSLRSSNGVTAYEMLYTSALVITSKGSVVTVNLKG